MRETNKSYCGECKRDFGNPEIVWYAPIENDCFCKVCKERLPIKDWEPALHGEGLHEN